MLLRHRQSHTNIQTKIHAVFGMELGVWKIICWLSLHFILFRFIFKYSNLFGNIILLNGSVYCFSTSFFFIHAWYEMRKRAKNSIEIDLIVNVPYYTYVFNLMPLLLLLLVLLFVEFLLFKLKTNATFSWLCRELPTMLVFLIFCTVMQWNREKIVCRLVSLSKKQMCTCTESSFVAKKIIQQKKCS